MNPKKVLLCCILLVAAIFIGCGKVVISKKPENCHTTFPKEVKGLTIRGPRPSENIIQNMVPIICFWRDQCIKKGYTNMQGTIYLTGIVNKVGELGVVRYTHTLSDSVFLKELIESFPLNDFDVWNEGGYETEFEYPIVLFEH
jgi:hypothetical protein